MLEISALGAVCALVIAMVMILREVPPAFGMLASATNPDRFFPRHLSRDFPACA